MRFAVTTLLLAAGALVAAPLPKEWKKPDDKTGIVGTWRTVRHDGREEAGNTWFRFDADGTLKTWHVTAVGSPQGWTVALDPTTTPKRATLTRAGNGGSYDCLYELTGDTLKVAFILNKDKGVPETLAPHPAVQLYELTREKPAK